MGEKKDPTKFDTISGYAAGIVMILAISLSSASVQGLQGAVPDFELTACRFIVQVFVFTSAGIIKGATFTLPRERIPAMLWYSTLCTLYNIGFYGASTYLPLLEVAGILKVVDMIAAVVQARILFHQEIGKVYSISLIVCSLSIILVIQPPWIFKHPHNAGKSCPILNSTGGGTRTSGYHSSCDVMLNSVENNTPWNFINNGTNTSIIGSDAHGQLKNPSVHDTAIGYTLILIGGVANGMMYDVICVMLHDVEPLVKAAYMSAGGIIAASAVALYTEEVVLRLSIKQYGLVLAHCFFAVFSAFSKVFMAHKIGGVRASITQCLLVMVMLLFQYTLMKSIMPGHQNWIEIVGALILTLGSLVPPIFDFIKYKKGSNTLP